MTERQDARGVAFAGSQLQTQIWANRTPESLNESVRAQFSELRSREIEWVSPLASDGYREYQDGAFLRRLGLGAHVDALARFWPSRGPVWDALAVVHPNGGQAGVILAEGKSYPQELFGSRCQAGPRSRGKILAALERTQAWLGVAVDGERWCGRLYQTANRLAHLYWLNEVIGIEAWLVHLLFVNDPHRRTTADEWDATIRAADAKLGLHGPVTRAGHVVLEAGRYEDLADGG